MVMNIVNNMMKERNLRPSQKIPYDMFDNDREYLYIQREPYNIREKFHDAANAHDIIDCRDEFYHDIIDREEFHAANAHDIIDWLMSV